MFKYLMQKICPSISLKDDTYFIHENVVLQRALNLEIEFLINNYLLES